MLSRKPTHAMMIICQKLLRLSIQIYILFVCKREFDGLENEQQGEQERLCLGLNVNSSVGNTLQLRNIVETVLNKNKKSNSGVRLPTPPNSSFITN